MGPAEIGALKDLAVALGANPAIVVVGYFLLRELRAWRTSWDAGAAAVVALAGAINKFTDQVVQRMVEPARKDGHDAR